MKTMRTGGMALVMVIGFLATARSAEAGAATLLVEAEQYCANPNTRAEPLEGASGGRVIGVDGKSGSPGYFTNRSKKTLRIVRAGRYTAWIRYYKRSPDFGGVGLLIQDEIGEQVAFFRCHFSLPLMSSAPYRPSEAPYLEQTGFVWERFDVAFERPMDVTLTLGWYPRGGGRWDDPKVDCLLFTTDEAFDPGTVDISGLARKARAEQPERARAAFGSYRRASPYVPHVDFFAGVSDPHGRFELALVNNWETFHDYPRSVALGFNHDHGYARGGAAIPQGVKISPPVESTGHVEGGAPPSPEGRMVLYAKSPDGTNWQRSIGRRLSLCYPPAMAGAQQLTEATMRKLMADPAANASIGGWRVSVEEGGWLDHSVHAQRAFRDWLKTKHGTIDLLNEVWGAQYGGFDQVTAPKSTRESMAGWLEFREFSGELYADRIAATVGVVRRVDPQGRRPVFQNSSLDLFCPYFCAFRPLDYDYYLNVALKDVDRFDWDSYAADDYLGAEVDYFNGIADYSKSLTIAEWNVHTNDERIAARTFWGVLSKGLKGLTCFMFQDPLFDASYPKWALLNPDFTPKPKLGAYADAAHEIHRLEPLFMESRVSYPVPPVAMYYSCIDLTLATARASQWGGGHDSPHRVYEVLRGAGYSVTWITPRQIMEGRLEEIGAVVMVDCQHVPADAACRLEAWVKRGGVVIGDRFPGARDEYGRPQQTLALVFGVRKVAAADAATKGNLGVQESTQGYGPETGLAFVPDRIEETIVEMYQQWDCQHPVARKIGPFHLSGYGYEKVDNVSGESIAMSYYTNPGIVLNDYGKGHALYFAAMMGTLYDGAATRYEWDSAHSGTSYQRVLSAFLEHAGVRPTARARIRPSKVRSLMRVETPLVTPDGNLLVGLMNYNASALQPFDLEVELPPRAREFGSVYVTTGGSREFRKLDFAITGTTLRLEMPAFDTHATIVAVRRFTPLIGLRFDGLERGDANLFHVHPGMEFTIDATVHNPSDQELPPGELQLYSPRGWFHRTGTLAVSRIAPWESRSATFAVKAPPVCGDKRLRPVVVKYRAGSVSSTPATELLWWSRAGDRRDQEWR